MHFKPIVVLGAAIESCLGVALRLNLVSLVVEAREGLHNEHVLAALP